MSKLPYNSLDLIDDVQDKTISKLIERDSIKIQIESDSRKRIFFDEAISIQLKYDDDGIQKSKEWRIQRFRLTKEFLQKLVDRLLFSNGGAGAIIAYLKESETGEVIIPDDMQKSCKPNSSTTNSSAIHYELFLSLPNKTKDILNMKNISYCGGMKFMLHNVPLYSQNSIHKVKSDHIRNWIIEGILHEDPEVQQKETKTIRIRESLNSTIMQMDRIADEPMLNEKGEKLSGKRAEKMREEKYLLLQRSKDQFHIQLDEALALFKGAKKKVIGKICLSTFQQEEKTTWEFLFTDEHREYFDNIIVNKKNWNTTYMYADSRINILDDDYSNFDSEYLVNTAGVSVKRLEDGFGIFHRRNDDWMKELRNFNSHVDTYHGAFRDGCKSGYGLLYTKAGIFGGDMRNDQQIGHGNLVNKDGDVLIGSFDMYSTSRERQNVNRINRYARSVPNGQQEIRFSDGSFYKGTMTNGEITGTGIYVTSKGDRMEGEFNNGSLVRGIQVKSHGDVIRQGEFNNGLLNGEGTLECKSMRTMYKGFFVDGSKHGMGEEVIFNKKGLVLSKYFGLFSNGKRSGLGRLDFCDVGFTDNSTNTFLEKDQLHLKGYWLSGQPKAGGMISKNGTHFAVPSTHTPISNFQWLCRLKKVEEKKENDLYHHCINIEKNDFAFRKYIETKKKSIFDKHHQTIKSMLFDEGDELRRHTNDEKYDHSKKILLSHTKHFSHGKVNKGSITLSKTPNISTSRLQMATGDSKKYEYSFIQKNIFEMAQRQWVDKRLQVFNNVGMKNIKQELIEMEEEWSMINMNKIHDFIQNTMKKEVLKNQS